MSIVITLCTIYAKSKVGAQVLLIDAIDAKSGEVKTLRTTAMALFMLKTQ